MTKEQKVAPDKICKCNGIAIDSAKARECIEEMNKNTVSKEFLKKCAETAKLFKRK